LSEMIAMKIGIEQIAESLDLPATTVDRWIRQGRIPVQKTGRSYSFDAAVLKKWAATHRLPFAPPPDAPRAQPAQPGPESLLAAITRGGVFHSITGETVPAVLASAVAVLPDMDEPARETLLETLLEREGMTSTGIGKGVAIPHPRAPLSEITGRPVITTCFLDRPVDFAAVDDRPVFVLFLLLSTSVKIHLHLLSRLAFCVRDNGFLDFLASQPRSEALFEKISAFEAHLDQTDAI
jgi:nitrogen PTS system EIIA component